jgi:hypothetical protein
LASWTSATDTPCFITSEVRCCQDAGSLCMFQEAMVSMAESSHWGWVVLSVPEPRVSP